MKMHSVKKCLEKDEKTTFDTVARKPFFATQNPVFLYLGKYRIADL